MKLLIRMNVSIIKYKNNIVYITIICVLMLQILIFINVINLIILHITFVKDILIVIMILIQIYVN